MRARVLIVGDARLLLELHAARDHLEIVGHVRSLDVAEGALRRLRPSVLLLDAELAHNEGFCSLPALRRASPDTVIVLPPVANPGPRLVRAIRMAAHDFDRRREGDGLTAREREIARLLALGHTNREIAERLVLSVRTVETHRARIQRRVEVRTRAELVRWALERGLLAP